MTFDSSWYTDDGTLALPDLVQVVRVRSPRGPVPPPSRPTAATTADLFYDATAADVQAALETLARRRHRRW